MNKLSKAQLEALRLARDENRRFQFRYYETEDGDIEGHWFINGTQRRFSQEAISILIARALLKQQMPSRDLYFVIITDAGRRALQEAGL